MFSSICSSRPQHRGLGLLDKKERDRVRAKSVERGLLRKFANPKLQISTPITASRRNPKHQIPNKQRNAAIWDLMACSRSISVGIWNPARDLSELRFGIFRSF